MVQPPTTREALVAAAEECLGTPFLHQGRKPRVGLDCAGLLLAVAASVGIQQVDYPRRNYSRFPLLGDHLRAFVAGQTNPIPVEEARPGSIYLFWIHREGLPQHLGMHVAPDLMIHAWSDAGAVVQSHLGPYWSARITGVFDFRGVI